ncbi:hypothetical protein PACILC2_07920 [Paenibacillus cisolokensis]|uniref:Stage V sporulation protein AD n=1 Tax=Paenibacillus cisolokensis TaxID=1658519 RepID=A0ABQ4N218_9BACL|nr:hypothetical protein PACILC2_07920 [Paenibacillus cisolokensis]
MLRGKQTWWFANRPVIIGTATVVGPDEGDGPLAADYDLIHPELDMQQKSWEKAERLLLEQASDLAMQHAGIDKTSCRSLSAAI